jgi:hypothetical protein
MKIREGKNLVKPEQCFQASDSKYINVLRCSFLLLNIEKVTVCASFGVLLLHQNSYIKLFFSRK